MKLHRIALQEFRKFRDPVVLDGLADGLNVIAGPNEAGKSTLAAAIRAAFLERYKTTKVSDLAPWGMSGARPSVEIAFQHDGHEYLLRKSFLSRARCELVVDDGVERHEGEAAENALASLLGFEFSAKGNSRPEHGGIPGLLWIAQGEGQNLLEPAGYAQSHVRDALTRLTGELTSADGDSLYERVEVERAALRDGRSGRPKGAYKDAEDALLRAEESVATLTASKQALDADVDRLALLRRDHDKAEQEQPWLNLEQRAAQARARLAEISRERDALAGLQRELTQADDTLALLHEQVERDQRDAAALVTLQADAEAAAASLVPAREALDRALLQQQRAAQNLAQANAQVAAAQQAAQRADCLAQIDRLNQELRRAQDSIVQAEQLAEQVRTLQASSAQLEIDDKALHTLRQLEQRLAQLQAQQNAGATRVHHRLLDGQTLQMAGRDVAGEGEVLVSEATELQIPGIGVLHIEPGGSDLPAILTAIQQTQTERTACLGRLGATSLAQAEARAVTYEQTRRDLDMARQTLRIQAPEGIEALRELQSQAQSRLTQLQGQLAVLPESAAAPVDLAQAQQALHAATVEADLAGQAVTSARTALDTQQTKAQIFQTQWAALQAELGAVGRVEQREQRGARLVEARATRDTLAQRCQAAQAALQALQPELIEQDAQRFEQSARLQREEQQRRHAELLQLQGKLEQAQAHGLGEQLLQAQAEAQRLTRRRDEFATRAQALDLLWQLLGQRRADATQRLLDPLAQRLQHYVGLLFPGAQWRLDDALMPAAVVRGTGPDATETLNALSFGTREQLGVLARFAYADLLQQAGRPTLLILDDTLVHADQERRELMKRALYDAASRHQMLLLTCHGEAWQDMGVGVRAVP
ncbi:AAA family ATPase [Bordetella genomosp. 4]|uniref:GTP-binding protein n=1 Tax=Bordetella genomosp. 4 TaxID=463044 RepID=A0A261U4C9_9BORD|nr:AAA family ATPase [Bordetella genomosp. 4]OZI56421.1 GTP-binding protein [Bordetella genomosp. 4]